MRTLTLIFLLIWALPDTALNCHPPINPQLPQYIVGYGSLMDEQSKKETDPTAEDNAPIIVKGYKRSWSLHGNLPGLNTTFLSLFKNKHASINGVIYKLSKPENIQLYDKRETTYYRTELHLDELNLYDTTLPHQKQIWIYSATQKANQYPTHDYPLVQSYVDLFIRGCIQIEEKYNIKHFAKDCIQNTEQWSEHWVNDRVHPRRPYSVEPYASKIDALLKANLPDKFKHIHVE